MVVARIDLTMICCHHSLLLTKALTLEVVKVMPSVAEFQARTEVRLTWNTSKPDSPQNEIIDRRIFKKILVLTWQTSSYFVRTGAH